VYAPSLRAGPVTGGDWTLDAVAWHCIRTQGERQTDVRAGDEFPCEEAPTLPGPNPIPAEKPVERDPPAEIPVRNRSTRATQDGWLLQFAT
jgi:hypothetical protein